MSTPRKRLGAPRRPRGAARAALIQAARDEFKEIGFESTDSNRIARRAGYAPQTFYWHFQDKAAIFAEVFKEFVVTEYSAIQSALADGPAAVASAIIKLHAEHRLFRRSLRALSVTDALIRSVRLETRRRQVAALVEAAPELTPDDALTILLATDRIADAAAEGELAELGVTDPAQLIASLWRRFAEATPM